MQFCTHTIIVTFTHTAIHVHNLLLLYTLYVGIELYAASVHAEDTHYESVREATD
jgi:hypothetical protein